MGTLIKEKGDLSFGIKDNRLYFLNKIKSKDDYFHYAMVSTLITGVSKGYRAKVRLIGVGYRASIKHINLILKIGYSHEVQYKIPEDIKITCGKVKGTRILIQGTELSRVRQVASEIRKLRLPDAYKGKGIHYDKEIITLKKGKREGK
jgi:large subunit ribosomal protein L6